MTPSPSLILASASPRRLELLRRLGLSPEVRPASLPELPREGEMPEALVRRLAEAKARHVAGDPADPAPRPRSEHDLARLVLGADTAVVLDGRALGKPRGAAGAVEMLRTLSGREHRVLTGVHLVPVGGDPANGGAGLVASTRVRFRRLSESEIAWYVSTGEPGDKAGAYGIQERGALLIESIRGSWTNVAGLPVERLPELFAAVGFDLLSLTRDR